MAENSITESQAQDLCRRKIKEYVAEAVRVVEETKKSSNISLHLRTYIEAILYSGVSIVPAIIRKPQTITSYYP